MRSETKFARGAVLSALLLLSTTPAWAVSKADRARAAIAEARGKIDAANKAGVSGEVPRMSTEAQALLHDAQEALARGHEHDAIAEANRASELADAAIGQAQRARADADAAQRAQAANAAAAQAAPATTTVTTQTVKQVASAQPRTVTKRRVVRPAAKRPAARSTQAVTEKTTTTVTTTPAQ